MSAVSRYKRMRDFNKRLISFKVVKPRKSETQLKKKRIMKNVDELSEKYYSTYKNTYDTDDELNEAKKKMFDLSKDLVDILTMSLVKWIKYLVKLHKI